MKDKKMKMYLSLPITGRDLKAVKVFAKRVKQKWERKGYDVVTPFEVTEAFDGVREGQNYYAYCMGKCVEALLMCDGAIFCQDWFNSKGCRTEWNVAEVYGIKRVLDDTKYLGGMEYGKGNQVQSE